MRARATMKSRTAGMPFSLAASARATAPSTPSGSVICSPGEAREAFSGLDPSVPQRGAARSRRTKGVDKSALTLPERRRVRDREHLRSVAQKACLVCGRKPSDPHHLRFAQLAAWDKRSVTSLPYRCVEDIIANCTAQAMRWHGGAARDRPSTGGPHALARKPSAARHQQQRRSCIGR